MQPRGADCRGAFAPASGFVAFAESAPEAGFLAGAGVSGEPEADSFGAAEADVDSLGEAEGDPLPGVAVPPSAALCEEAALAPEDASLLLPPSQAVSERPAATTATARAGIF
ncbi:hypothetical protein ACIBK8_11895 [Streptomyces sp. NPDC050161]|uniref:hypothetical protein n=1 Tax=Streptomyces sp. NPDC050161 TaxID=3365604 RepID=UPI003790BF3D